MAGLQNGTAEADVSATVTLDDMDLNKHLSQLSMIEHHRMGAGCEYIEDKSQKHFSGKTLVRICYCTKFVNKVKDQHQSFFCEWRPNPEKPWVLECYCKCGKNNAGWGKGSTESKKRSISTGQMPNFPRWKLFV
eukprot:GHVU01217590.1.p1 GENE.GHVU01217590.1~~GHVU01217590.1.p1  ORF type:complete len:134 (+),score=9.89 GHVU01217590.1:104-505(+)